MPLLGCLMVLGFAIGLIFLMLVYGYFRFKYIAGGANERIPERARSLGLRPELDSVRGIPFEVPEGYLVRSVVRTLPCGKEQRYFVVIPLDEPCSGSVSRK